MFTAFLREQVPVLEYVDWKITAVRPGEVETVLPLNPNSTNQHFTHQAALIVLSADYSGGAALASLFLGWPVIGVHPVDSQKSVSMWLLKAEMKYVRPSTGDLTVKASVDSDRHERIQKRFLQGKPVIETITMQFMNGDELIAEGTCTYFARQSTALQTNGINNGKINSLYALKLTSSAEMIAGVRAQENGTLFSDPYAETMAGQHGVAVASRFCQRTPQLGPMVAARTRHLDELMHRFMQSGGRHIVNIGVGWDMRLFRLNPPEGTTFYELDFPSTLDERTVRLEKNNFKIPKGIARVPLPIDLRCMTLPDVLDGVVPKDEPILFVWEGMSMYFEEPDTLRILGEIKSMLTHSDSMLWFDLVDREPVVNPAAFPESIQNFMHGMQILGEPFVFGSDAPQELLEKAGLRCLDVVTSDVYFPETTDPLFSIYQFCTAAGAATETHHVPKAFRRPDLPHKVPTVPRGQVVVDNSQSSASTS
ncbi:YiiD C-terminal domain-containing protein [Aeoliella mucimassa]|nr:YiiD C-terminal domain-containing protein [Aeoliella mucimassa]